MMERPNRPTFKPRADTFPGHVRRESPLPPPVEPLSPVTTTSTPFSLFMSERIHKHVPPTRHANSHREEVRARKDSDVNSHYHTGDHRRKSSNTIDDLAHIANLVRENAQVRSSLPLYGSSASLQKPSLPHVWSTVQNPIATTTRPPKRARSETEAFIPYEPPARVQKRERPSTSIMPAQATPAQNLNRDYEAAELLLGFAARSSKPLEPIPIYPAGSSMPVPPSLQHLWSQPTKMAPSPSQSSEAQYLPSPHPTGDDPQEPANDPWYSRVPDREDQVAAEPRRPGAVQIRTPPEDETIHADGKEPDAGLEPELEAEGQRQLEFGAVEDHLDHFLEIEKTPTDADDAKPKRRGWPKGKPRGPKKAGGLASSRTKSAAARRSRKSGRKPSDDSGMLKRRASFSDFEHPILEAASPARAHSVPAECRFVPGKARPSSGRRAGPKFTKNTVCEACRTQRESAYGETDSWIGCDGCKKWYHWDCAGFSSSKDVNDVDKFFCVPCEPKHGKTSFVRKSTRAHAMVDYAGLNQGVLRTSDECKEHHYIQSIKDGVFKFDPETFPRMRPELATADYFERSAMFNQPVLIPAEFNPKPGHKPTDSRQHDSPADERIDGQAASTGTAADEDELLPDYEYETVPDDGQDKLDMVIPQNLTVRKVCELVGADYPLDVIDTKVQNTGAKKWNLGMFADYYEQEGEKDIRNVISLEVSDTKLGKLLRRPKVVRQIDLQDSVWPKDEPRKGVSFYCLMSAADSYTDFHIDFGGSSVYYHILRGSKTFLFIPPTPKNLKAYEEWNESQSQNFTWLPGITEECYRVDLFQGDTMLIPSGWIHAVWTPSNSLVIGGNFLTRMHYEMQFKVNTIEKANRTPQKFRYPKFQKVMWYALLRYLREDPLPDSVRDIFHAGQKFRRDYPAWQDFEIHGTRAKKGDPDYNARYYSQMELDGLPDLLSFIFRTVMIFQDRIDGITQETRKSVNASIPKSYGDPFELAKTFALWVAWKRGNQDPPAWVHSDAGLPEKEAAGPKKLSEKKLKQMQRLEASEALRLAPERQSERRKQQEAAKARDGEQTEVKTDPLQPPTTAPKTSGLGPKRIACDGCRRRRIRCKHKEDLVTASSDDRVPTDAGRRPSRVFDGVVVPKGASEGSPVVQGHHGTQSNAFPSVLSSSPFTPIQAVSDNIMVAPMSAPQFISPALPTLPSSQTVGESSSKRGRSKACAECRKSKRRCIHDENGLVDPIKEQQTPIPRSNASKKRSSSDAQQPPLKRPKKEGSTGLTAVTLLPGPSYNSNFSASQISPATYTPNIIASLPGEAIMIDPQLMAQGTSKIPASYRSAMSVGDLHHAGQFQTEQSFKDSRTVSIDPTLAQVGVPSAQAPAPEPPSMRHEIASNDSGVDLAESQLEPMQVQRPEHQESIISGTIQKQPDSWPTVTESSAHTAHECGLPSLSAKGEAQDAVVSRLSSEGIGGDQTIDCTDTRGAAEELRIQDTTDAVTDSAYASTSRPQTPAANEPPSLSSASSPLSSPNVTPEPLEDKVATSTEQRKRHSARNVKPVERFSASVFAGSLLHDERSSPKIRSKDAADVLDGIRDAVTVASKRKSSSSLTPAPVNGAVDRGALSSPAKARSKTPAEAKTAEQLAEEESERLARKLAGENFGLRARRSLA